MATLRQQLSALDALSPNMEKTFREAIDDIKSEIALREIVERLERRDHPPSFFESHLSTTL
ncbi:hypothetical protein IE4872_CH01780 [Rhizobium gallicum]|uniref:Uncharacterized protein n=1 Tax=Rhizobium gallicum TaxID=56730 RepID=A0A1L5NHS7_9HYPH|nr:hypothetical protein [Rhizobium gallicum]APO67409.1 hypothetical protein IE4872_CH01780 [Rhizobium gallicum]